MRCCVVIIVVVEVNCGWCGCGGWRSVELRKNWFMRLCRNATRYSLVKGERIIRQLWRFGRDAYIAGAARVPYPPARGQPRPELWAGPPASTLSCTARARVRAPPSAPALEIAGVAPHDQRVPDCAYHILHMMRQIFLIPAHTTYYIWERPPMQARNRHRRTRRSIVNPKQ